MITTSQLKCTENILSDFKYAKEFKTPLVLFTESHQVIGLGEFMSYVKIETNKQLQSFLSNTIVETKNFAKLFKAISKQDLNTRIFYNGRNPMNLCTTKQLSIGLGIAVEQVTYSILNLFKDIKSNFAPVYIYDLTNGDFLNSLKKLKIDEGSIDLPIHTKDHGDWIIPMTKKMLPVVATDKVSVELLIHKTNPNNLYAYICFLVVTKDKFVFETYFKILKV